MGDQIGFIYLFSKQKRGGDAGSLGPLVLLPLITIATQTMCVPDVVFKLKFENNNYKVSKNEAMPEKNLAVSMFVK